MRKILYTTSEYIDALELQCDGNLYHCKGKDFGLFSNRGAAQYDADWSFNYWLKEGKPIRRHKVYRIKLERLK